LTIFCEEEDDADDDEEDEDEPESENESLDDEDDDDPEDEVDEVEVDEDELDEDEADEDELDDPDFVGGEDEPLPETVSHDATLLALLRDLLESGFGAGFALSCFGVVIGGVNVGNDENIDLGGAAADFGCDAESPIAGKASGGGTARGFFF